MSEESKVMCKRQRSFDVIRRYRSGAAWRAPVARFLAGSVVCLLSVGSRADSVEGLALRIEPSSVTMPASQSVVLFDVVDEAEQNGEALSLVWEVKDPTLGRIITSRGLTAVYRRTASRGENILVVRDQRGHSGKVVILQKDTTGAVHRSAAAVAEPDAGRQRSVPDESRSDAVVRVPAPGDSKEAAPQERAVQYTLLIGDEISLDVFREPDLSGTYRVEQGGVIRHELFGTIELAGLTVLQAETLITQVLSQRYLVNPRVTVRVVSSQASEVLVMGEVKSPGARQIPFEGSTTLLEVIAAAGGFTDLASVNRVQVIRQEDGRQRRIRVRVARIMSGADPDFEILPNDVIMVPQTFF